jgi:hypothetical protein
MYAPQKTSIVHYADWTEKPLTCLLWLVVDWKWNLDGTSPQVDHEAAVWEIVAPKKLSREEVLEGYLRGDWEQINVNYEVLSSPPKTLWGLPVITWGCPEDAQEAVGEGHEENNQ